MRPSSPSRRETPHPPGLTLQTAYNKYDEQFWIWNPNRHRLRRRYAVTLPYIEQCNFTCRHDPEFLQSRIVGQYYPQEPYGVSRSLDDYARQIRADDKPGELLPTIHPTLRTTQVTRFSRRPSDPSLVGILPGSSQSRLRPGGLSHSIDFAMNPR